MKPRKHARTQISLFKQATLQVKRRWWPGTEDLPSAGRRPPFKIGRNQHTRSCWILTSRIARKSSLSNTKIMTFSTSAMKRNNRIQRMITWQSLATSTSFLKYLKTLCRCSGHHLQKKSVYKKIKANLRGFNSSNHLIRQAIDSLKASKPAAIRIRFTLSKTKCLKKLCVKIKVLNQIAPN